MNNQHANGHIPNVGPLFQQLLIQNYSHLGPNQIPHLFKELLTVVNEKLNLEKKLCNIHALQDALMRNLFAVQSAHNLSDEIKNAQGKSLIFNITTAINSRIELARKYQETLDKQDRLSKTPEFANLLTYQTAQSPHQPIQQVHVPLKKLGHMPQMPMNSTNPVVNPFMAPLNSQNGPFPTAAHPNFIQPPKLLPPENTLQMQQHFAVTQRVTIGEFLSKNVSFITKPRKKLWKERHNETYRLRLPLPVFYIQNVGFHGYNSPIPPGDKDWKTSYHSLSVGVHVMHETANFRGTDGMIVFDKFVDAIQFLNQNPQRTRMIFLHEGIHDLTGVDGEIRSDLIIIGCTDEKLVNKVVITRSDGKPIFHFFNGSTRSYLRNLTVASSSNEAGLMIEGNEVSPTFHNCHFLGVSDQSEVLVKVGKGANPKFSHCMFLKAQNGLVVFKAKGSFERCAFKHLQTGATVFGPSNPQFANNQFNRCSVAGVILNRESNSFFVLNEFSECFVGIKLIGAFNSIVDHCKFSNNKCNIAAEQKSKALFRYNFLQTSERKSITIRDKSQIGFKANLLV